MLTPHRQFSSRGPSQGRNQLLLLAAIVVSSLGLALVMSSLPYLISTAVVVGIAVFIICFISTEFGLYLLVFSMLLSPELGAGSLGGPSASTASRGVTIRLEDLLLMLLGFAWLIRMAVHKDVGLVRDNPLNGPIGYYIAAVIITTMAGAMWPGRVDGKTGFFFVLKYIEYFVVFFIVLNNIQSRQQVVRYTGALLLTAVIVSFVAIAQIPGGGRVSAPFEGETGEPNTLGGYLLLMASVAGGLMMHMRESRIRLAMLGLLLLFTVPLIFTQSRGSWLAVPFIYLTFMLFYPGKRVIMLLILLVVSFVGWEVMPSVMKERIMFTFTQVRQRGQTTVGGATLDTSTSARLTSYANAFVEVQSTPIWGYGVTGYGFLDAQYPRVMAESGVIGIVTFAVMIGAVFRVAYKAHRESEDDLYQGLSVGLIAGLVGLLIHGLGANTFIIVRIMEPFWLIVGLVVSAHRMERAGRQVGDSAEDRSDDNSATETLPTFGFGSLR